MTTSRQIVAFNRVTADGYFAAADGSLSWVVPEPEVDRAAAGSSDCDTILFGRKTYEMFESFWPKALDNPAATPDPHDGGQPSPEQPNFAVMLNQMTKIVFSRTRKEVTWNNSRIVGELDVREVAAMKQQPGRNIIIFGSSSIVSQLTAHRLIDEYLFVVSPTFLGGGRPLIHDVPERVGLTLVDLQRFESGTRLLRYGVRR